MDIKPVSRSSVARALLLWLAYCCAVVLFLWWINGPLSRPIAIAFMVVFALILAFELRAFREKNRHEDGLDMTIYGAFAQGRTVVAAPVEESPLVVLAVCAENEELGLTENNPSGGKISTGISFSTWGERIRYSVRPLSPTASEVTATCRPVSPFRLTNRGHSEKRLHEFLEAMHRGLSAPDTAGQVPSGSPRSF